MTTVTYDCIDAKGNRSTVKTFEEAKRIKEAGGRYTVKFNTTLSQGDAYCRDGARRAGDMR